MAIDTSEKRLSILDIDPTTSPGIPFPYVEFGTPEQLHILWLYSGLLDETSELQWPFDELKPRHIGIYPVAAPIGGGVSLTGKEPTIATAGGYWRIVLGGIPVKTRANILLYRGMEASLEGRGRSVAITIPDGKRAPWPGTPGGTIDAESVSDVPAGSTGLQIVPIDIGEVEVGMHFSVEERLYRLIRVDGESGVVDCIIWPPVREAWSSGQALEFRRPVCRVRQASDDGMALALQGHKRNEATLEFVEDV